MKNREIKESLIQDDNIKGPLNLAKNADVILTSVGSVVYKSWHNYLSSKVFDALEEKGVVGHIGGHFFNIYGQELDSALTERMIGIDMDDFKMPGNNMYCFWGEKSGSCFGGNKRKLYQRPDYG